MSILDMTFYDVIIGIFVTILIFALIIFMMYLTIYLQDKDRRRYYGDEYADYVLNCMLEYGKRKRLINK